MIGQPDGNTKTMEDLAPAEQERQERAGAPTLRDLQKAAQGPALVGVFAGHLIGQPNLKQAEAYSANNVFAQ